MGLKLELLNSEKRRRGRQGINGTATCMQSRGKKGRESEQALHMTIGSPL